MAVSVFIPFKRVNTPFYTARNWWWSVKHHEFDVENVILECFSTGTSL